MRYEALAVGIVWRIAADVNYQVKDNGETPGPDGGESSPRLLITQRAERR